MTEPGSKNFDYENKIAALLLKAEKTTPEEAAALTEAAERMMLKYGIEQAVINAKRAGKTHATNEQMMRLIIPYTGVYAKAMRMAMIAAVNAFGAVKIVVDDDRAAKIEYMWLVGFESDVNQMKVLVTSLQLQCISALSTWAKNADFTGMTAMQKYKARRTFIVAFGDGVAYRISTARRQIIDESDKGEPGTDLVLRDRKSEVDSWANKQFNLTPGKAIKMSMNYTGYGAGHDAGKNANTGEGALKQTKQISN